MPIPAHRIVGLAAAIIVTGGLAVSLAGSATAASAAIPPPAARPVTASPGEMAQPIQAAASCYASPRRGVPNVAVRRHRSVNSDFLGLMPNQLVPTDCATTAGSPYLIKGCEASNQWLRVQVPQPGWVPRGCIHWTIAAS
ncbi:hypothetical protein [Luedemannella helvata]|uniref:SH3 domain-containing protein n=1 Tax=Luedemannella helvata TaxID=349315 RepID=A0ABP4WYK1_9ACTN